jgi:hypothetical protein
MTQEPATDKEKVWGGIAAAGLGGFILLMGLGVIPYDPRSLHGPVWMVILAGLLFTMVGISLVVGALSRTIDASGEMKRTAPLAARVFYYVLGLLVCGGLAVMGSWVAFGPGPRTFGATGPLLATRDIGETIGRVVFGIGAVLTWLCLIALAVGGGRKLFGQKR